MFKWFKGYTIKKGKEAAYDDRISMYATEKDGYNSYFDLIPEIKNVNVNFKSTLKSIDFKKDKLILMVKNKVWYFN